MSENLIFVSCGQQTSEEKSLGMLLKNEIDGTPGFRAYFAETVQDLEGLSTNVFDALRRCAGAVVVLHDRGAIMDMSGKPSGNRSSVWVNQEIAILAYRQFSETRRIPILAFTDPKVKLEGAMTSLIVNPRPLADPQTVVNEVKGWLSREQFASVSDDVFMDKWNQLTESARKSVACLLDEGGSDVRENVVRKALMNSFGMGKPSAREALSEAKGQLENIGLVKINHVSGSGDYLSVHPTWEFHLRRQVAKWHREQDA